MVCNSPSGLIYFCHARPRPLKNVNFCLSSRKAIILTTGIHEVFRGLKFEPDTEIEQKGVFCKGLRPPWAAPEANARQACSSGRGQANRLSLFK
jgi:hypothetical protein